MSIDTLFNGKKPNILFLMNDQQRALQHWPESWETTHLPAMQRLKKNGLSFERAFTVANACSSSRGSLLTGTYPTLHGVKNTLSMPGDSSGALNPGGLPLVLNELRPTDPNLGQILAKAGYHAVWKGKWHLSLPRDGGTTWTSADIRYMKEAYGFDGWNPPDAGNSESDVTTLGAGAGDNDERYISGGQESDGSSPSMGGALEFLRNYQEEDGPFFLTISLVNPHDIWVAPNFSPDSGYTKDFPNYNLKVPATFDESLALKPAAQAYFKALEASLDDKPLDQASRGLYVNFYAYLQTLVDAMYMRVLNLLDERGLTDNTLIIRLSDHGEMGLSHGLREKDLVAYDEATRIPLIFSNPVAFPRALRNDALVTNVDIAPTLARLTGTFEEFSTSFQGEDLGPLLRGETDSVQEYVHFMTDDASVPAAATPNLPIFIRMVRTEAWMYSVYFNPAANADVSGTDCQNYQYELYDLATDPEQSNNLAGQDDYQEQQETMHRLLEDAMRKFCTVPPGFMLWTPSLQEIIDRDGSLGNPVWPTASDAFTGSANYLSQGGWQGSTSSSQTTTSESDA